MRDNKDCGVSFAQVDTVGDAYIVAAWLAHAGDDGDASLMEALSARDWQSETCARTSGHDAGDISFGNDPGCSASAKRATQTQQASFKRTIPSARRRKPGSAASRLGASSVLSACCWQRTSLALRVIVHLPGNARAATAARTTKKRTILSARRREAGPAASRLGASSVLSACC